jgi:Asp-tRNA(Asn)/Glu-tRNA(Gln) amidotransferase A subunit family amidase
MSDLIHLTLPEIARRISSGALTSEALTRAFLDQTARREPEVQAWEYLDPDYALAQAKALDRQTPRSPLHGVPIAIKDVLDTFDMPT